MRHGDLNPARQPAVAWGVGTSMNATIATTVTKTVEVTRRHARARNRSQTSVNAIMLSKMIAI